MTTLIEYGWGQSQQEFYSSISSSLTPGRVCAVKGFKYYVSTELGELEAELSGRLLFENENAFLPKTGDWVLLTAYDTMGYIVEVFPRKNALARKNPGKKVEAQILASNIDYAVIVQGLDSNFNLMRLERYIVQIVNCGIDPVVLLNKADLVTDHEHYIQQVNRLQRDVPVYLCSTVTGQGFPALEQDILQTGKTCVLIGSSGVGKSSILNYLLDQTLQRTGAVSESNKKGRHTTTTRELFMLSGGALVIDTPGMREFGLIGGDEDSGVDDFPALQELSRKCHYSDCQHLNEPGCAVLAGLQDGSLDPLIYESYIKLMKEQRRFTISVTQKKQQAKQFGRIIKEVKQHRKRYKF
jgi:ribosome biogenesis GTPase / thiamine phosphate phosphatase